jgi:hypothetical protein
MKSVEGIDVYGSQNRNIERSSQLGDERSTQRNGAMNQCKGHL